MLTIVIILRVLVVCFGLNATLIFSFIIIIIIIIIIKRREGERKGREWTPKDLVK